jgi:hypothetical protein
VRIPAATFLLAAALLACGTDPGADVDERSEPYELCDGSTAVRLAIASDGGGPLESSFEFTNPYGHRFLYVTGECRFLTGASLAGATRVGTLTDAQALQLGEMLELDRFASWPAYQDQSCPDAGIFYVETLAGYGECSCYCDEEGPEGVAETIEAAQGVLDALDEAGEVLSGPVEVVAFLRPDDFSATVEPWPLDLDLADIELPYSDFVHGTPPPVHVLDGVQAEAARALRATVVTDGGPRPVYVRSEAGKLYEVHIRDQVPAELAAAIGAFRQRP